MVRREHQTIQEKVITKMDKIPNQTNLQAIQKMMEEKIMMRKILLAMEEVDKGPGEATAEKVGGSFCGLGFIQF